MRDWLRAGCAAAIGLWLLAAPVLGAKIDPDVAALMAAARSGDTATVELLLDRGLDINVRDYGQWTPVVWAAAYLHYDTVKRLIARGADLEAVGRAGKNSGTALMWAAKKLDSLDVVRLLLDSGAKVDGTDQYGRTALMMAARHGRIESILFLLSRGADVNAVSTLPRNRTALELAEHYQPRRVADLLRGAGAKEWDELPPARTATWYAAHPDVAKAEAEGKAKAAAEN